MAQWVQDLALLQLWFRSKLWLKFDLGPQNFHVPQVQQGRGRIMSLQMESRIQRPGGDLSKHRSNKACALGPGGGLNLSTMTY